MIYTSFTLERRLPTTTKRPCERVLSLLDNLELQVRAELSRTSPDKRLVMFTSMPRDVMSTFKRNYLRDVTFNACGFDLFGLHDAFDVDARVLFAKVSDTCEGFNNLVTMCDLKKDSVFVGIVCEMDE